MTLRSNSVFTCAAFSQLECSPSQCGTSGGRERSDHERGRFSSERSRRTEFVACVFPTKKKKELSCWMRWNQMFSTSYLYEYLIIYFDSVFSVLGDLETRSFSSTWTSFMETFSVLHSSDNFYFAFCYSVIWRVKSDQIASFPFLSFSITAVTPSCPKTSLNIKKHVYTQRQANTAHRACLPLEARQAVSVFKVLSSNGIF